MKRATKRLFALMTAFLIVFTTVFGNASFSVRAEENVTTIATADVSGDSTNGYTENVNGLNLSVANASMTASNGNGFNADHWSSGEWHITFDGSGYTGLTLNCKMRSSNTGPANFTVVSKDAAGNSSESETLKELTKNLANRSFSLIDGATEVIIAQSGDASVNGKTVQDGGVSSINNIVITGTKSEGGSEGGSEGSTEDPENPENPEKEKCADVVASPEAGEVEKDTLVTLSCATEGATIFYNLGGDGFSEYTQETEIKIAEDTTVTAFASAEGFEDSEKVSFAYTVKAEEEPSEEVIDDGASFVVVYGSDNIIMTTNAKSSKLEGVAATVKDGNLFVEEGVLDSVALLTANKVEDGKYTLTLNKDGKTSYLTTKATGGSLSFADAQDDQSLWKIEKATAEGSYRIGNCTAVKSNKPQYIEYYNGLFTTYGYTGGDDTAFSFRLCDSPKETPAPLKAGTRITDLSSLADDQDVVLVFGDNKALSNTVNGKKLEGYDVKLGEDGRLICEVQAESTGELVAPTAIAALRLVKAETDGQYYLVSDIKETDSEGKETVTTRYLTTGATGNSLSFEAEKNDYSLWTFAAEEDGTFMVKSVNAVYKEVPQYIEYFKDLFTAYSYKEGSDKTAYKLGVFTFPELTSKETDNGNTVGKLLTRELYNEDKVVIYYPAGKKVMTAEAGSQAGKIKDAAVEISEDGTLETKDTGAAVLTVERDENGYLSFRTNDGKYLTGLVEEKTDANGKTKSYANLYFTDDKTDNSVWKQESAGTDGQYYLKNTVAKVGSSVQALEYYSGFALYGFKEDNAYKFSFYALAEGEKTVSYKFSDTSLVIAQWAGNAHYNEVATSSEYINGDLYKTNDMQDTAAKYSAVVNGSVSKPWTSAESSATGSTNYYMGSTGVINKDTDYMQFAFSSLGYGNMNLKFRMRASNTAAGAFQAQYSTDGENFKNLKNGTYSFKYTAYKASTDKVDENGKAVQEPYEVAGSGDITDGIVKTSLAPTYYVTFGLEIPNAAANAENIYIRLVPSGDLSAKGDKAPAKGGVIRVDGVEIKGNPVVDDSVTGYVVADPTSGEISTGQEIALSTSTEGAEIFYSVNGGEFVKYDDAKKVTFSELPASIRTYATKEGLSKSITATYQYTQAQVAAVKANPNGGAVFENQYVSLKTKTEGATILYRFRTAEEIAKDDDQAPAGSGENEGAEGEDAGEEETHDDWKEASGSIQLTELPCQMQVKAVKTGYKDSAVSTLKFTKRNNEKFNIYFGQVHAHTNISDGAGTLEEALQHASKVDNLDYIVITDHSNSIDNEKESKITENVDKSATDEWTYAHNLAKQYTTEDFTCAYGYEMTWSNGLGHINTFNTPGFQSRTQTEYSTYSTALQNYYAALRTVPDSISQFNHPGTTFGDFQDFAYYSEENDDLITMIEVGNGEGTIGSSGYFPSYEYYTRALDKGWHVAPTNNQDNHKGKWGDANTARTVMLADTNDEDAIYDAMKNYRIYATEDNDLSIYYTLEGNIMGTILEKDAVGDNLSIKADISDPTDSRIGKVEVIVNGGQSIDSKELAASGTVEFTVPSNYSYYYLKITEADGDIAVTAPVWVGEVEACGINKVYTNTVLPVKGESLDLHVDLYNNEEKELVIDNIDILLTDVDKKETKVVSVTGEEAGITSVAPEATATFSTDFVYNEAGQVTYEVTVHGTLNGVPKVYTDKLQLSYVVPQMVTDVLIDGTHYNDYVTGYYGGNMSSFISICAKKNIRAKVETEKITPEMLAKTSLLVVSAPAKKNGTANAGDYSISHYEAEFLDMLRDYVANGGSIIVCGLADYSDTTDGQTYAEQDKLLEAIGSTIRMGSDEVCDDTNNGGQVYRLYPNTYNLESGFFEGLRDGQKYSQYSGCSVDISNATATDFVDAAKWLVNGYDTTYSVDCKDPSGNAQGGDVGNGVKGIKNDNLGNVTFLATQHTKAGGDIFVSGGVFVSDFEVKAEIDNNDSLPYTNYTIVNNILDGVTVELPTSTIAQARAGKMNEVFAVEGYVTSGTDNENTTFFDTIYLQDETAGIDIFPYATPGLAIGTKMRIVGYVSQYQGDKELKIISSKILSDDPVIYEPKVVSTEKAMDYEALGGSLLKTTGKITRVAFASDNKTVEEFWIADETGKEAAIFIDGYINSATTGTNELYKIIGGTNTVSAVGILYMHPEGDSEESVPVFRVRNCDDIELVEGETFETPQTGGGEEPTPVDPVDPTPVDPDPTEPVDPVKEKCAAVVASPASGEIKKDTVVTLSCDTPGAIIRYSINDSDYTEYVGGIQVAENMTIKAYASAEGYDDGDKSTFTYTVKVEPEKTPVQKVVEAVVQVVVKVVTKVVKKVLGGLSKIFKWFW